MHTADFESVLVRLIAFLTKLLRGKNALNFVFFGQLFFTQLLAAIAVFYFVLVECPMFYFDFKKQKTFLHFLDLTRLVKPSS